MTHRKNELDRTLILSRFVGKVWLDDNRLSWIIDEFNRQAFYRTYSYGDLHEQVPGELLNDFADLADYLLLIDAQEGAL